METSASAAFAELPVVDHHCHLAFSESAVAAARRFEEAGGSHLFLATQAYSAELPQSVEAYRDQFEKTSEIARRVEASTAVTVYVVIAPHPTDLPRLSESLGLDEAVGVQKAALDLAGQWVREHRAVALGEVGLPHFAVPPATAEAASTLLRHALEVARDADCPAVIHSSDLDAGGFRSLAEVARRAGFPTRRLVKHFARSVVPSSDRAGVVPSYLASRELASASIGTEAPWFWETDYLDDPGRPGAVLDLATVPRRARHAIERAPSNREALRIPFETSVRSVYGFTPARGPGRST
ncbi:MAG: TatD family hydrolase [Thermoplasmata archaeon]|nr:TatD family hydrolase [Thermoplasmata archaeon]